MKQNRWRTLLNQGYGIKFIAAVLGLALLCVTAFAVGGSGSEKAALGGDSGSSGTAFSGISSQQKYQAISYENSSQEIMTISSDDIVTSTHSVASKVIPSRPDTVSYADASRDCGEISSYAETYSGDPFSLSGTCSGGACSRDTFSGETHSTIVQPSLKCVRPSGSASSWRNTGSRTPGGFLWMSDEQIRDEIDTLKLKRCYSLPAKGEGRSFDFDMFSEILKIIKQYEWQTDNCNYNVYWLKGNEIEIIGHHEVYSYLGFARDEQGRGVVWSTYDYKMAYLSEEDYLYICDLLTHAR